MKIRKGFISNSSSTSFIITNKSNKKLNIMDFAEENIYLVSEYNKQYSWNNYSAKELLISATGYNEEFGPHESKNCIFGDEDGTVIGHMYDYILREGGESENWKWEFYESLH